MHTIFGDQHVAPTDAILKLLDTIMTQKGAVVATDALLKALVHWVSTIQCGDCRKFAAQRLSSNLYPSLRTFIDADDGSIPF